MKKVYISIFFIFSLSFNNIFTSDLAQSFSKQEILLPFEVNERYHENMKYVEIQNALTLLRKGREKLLKTSDIHEAYKNLMSNSDLITSFAEIEKINRAYQFLKEIMKSQEELLKEIMKSEEERQAQANVDQYAQDFFSDYWNNDFASAPPTAATEDDNDDHDEQGFNQDMAYVARLSDNDLKLETKFYLRILGLLKQRPQITYKDVKSHFENLKNAFHWLTVFYQAGYLQEIMKPQEENQSQFRAHQSAQSLSSDYGNNAAAAAASSADEDDDDDEQQFSEDMEYVIRLSDDEVESHINYYLGVLGILEKKSQPTYKDVQSYFEKCKNAFHWLTVFYQSGRFA